MSKGESDHFDALRFAHFFLFGQSRGFGARFPRSACPPQHFPKSHIELKPTVHFPVVWIRFSTRRFAVLSLVPSVVPELNKALKTNWPNSNWECILLFQFGVWKMCHALENNYFIFIFSTRDSTNIQVKSVHSNLLLLSSHFLTYFISSIKQYTEAQNYPN